MHSHIMRGGDEGTPRGNILGLCAIYYISGTELVFYYNYDPPEPDSPVRHPSRRLTSDVATDCTYLFGAPRRHGSGMAPARFWHTFGV